MMRQEKLGRICKEIYRYPTYYDIDYLDSGVPEVRGELIKSDGTLEKDWRRWRFISAETSARFPKTTLECGDLVMSVRGTIGKLAIVDKVHEGANITANLIRLSPDRDEVDPKYLWNYMRSGEFIRSIEGETSSTTISTIKAPDLKNIHIPLPPLDEQRRIAAILDQAEALRAKRRDSIVQTEDLTQSLFLNTFGNPATNPRGWPIVKVGDLLESATYGTSQKADAQGALPILRMGNLTSAGYLDLSDLKYIDLTPEEMDRYTVKNNDLLFNRTNSAELVGKTALYDLSTTMAYAGYLIRLRTNDKAHPVYLVRFLNSSYAKKVLRGMCKSIIGMANINATEIQAMAVPLPPLSLQHEFAAQVAAVERLKAAQRASLAALDELFASLQHRAFRGELTPPKPQLSLPLR